MRGKIQLVKVRSAKDEDLDGALSDLSEVEVGSRWVTQMRV